MKVVCITSDYYLWAVKPFAYLFNLFWSEKQDVIVAGFSQPDFKLPDNFSFYCISTESYPKGRWSNAFLKFLNSFREDHFVLMLEDYWLCRTVDVRGVAAAYEYTVSHPDVLRFDLTADREHTEEKRDVDYYGSYDIVETPNSAPYQMSLQCAIWSRHHLLNVIHPNMSAWEVELQTSIHDSMRVLGTRQWPVRYANAILKGDIDPYQLELIPHHLRETIKQWTPTGWRAEV